MQIGVVFPQTEIGGDAGAVRAYAQRVEELGYAHVVAYDHVVGADPAVHKGWEGPYDLHSTFHEPLVMFGYLAALTSLELVTGIIILPQRQTALWPNRRPRSIFSPGADSVSVLVSDGTRRVRSPGQPSPTGASGSNARSSCSGAVDRPKRHYEATTSK